MPAGPDRDKAPPEPENKSQPCLHEQQRILPTNEETGADRPAWNKSQLCLQSNCEYLLTNSNHLQMPRLQPPLELNCLDFAMLYVFA